MTLLDFAASAPAPALSVSAPDHPYAPYSKNAPPDFGSPAPLAEDHRRRRTFKIETCDTLRARAEDSLVKNLWPRVGIGFVAGSTMAGKTFLTLQLIDGVARGNPVLGRRSKRAGVVYVAAEGENGVRKRIEGLRQERGSGWAGHMQFIGAAPNLNDDEDVTDLRNVLHAQKQEMGARGIRLGIVVIDTLSASIPGADENAAKDMSKILSTLQRIGNELEVFVLLVAHFGKDTERGLRGWSGLTANADSLIQVQLLSDRETRVATIVKVKDGEAGEDFKFKLKSIELGRDSDGDPITTCVVAGLEKSASQQKDLRRPLPASAQAALRALKLVLDHGLTIEIAAPGVKLGTLGVSVGELRTRFDANSTDPRPNSDEEPHQHKLWKDRQRKAFENGVSKLIERGLIRSENGQVWQVDQHVPTQ